MRETWLTNVAGFAFLVLMLALMVVCCSCTQAEPTPVVVDGSSIRAHTPAAMAEQTVKFNEEMERRFKR